MSNLRGLLLQLRNELEEQLYDKIHMLKVAFSSLLIGVFFACIVFLPPFADYLQIFSLRMYFQLRGPIQPPENIVLAAVDDTTYIDLNLGARQAFPRKYTAEVFKRLVSASPRVVIADMKFPPEENAPGVHEKLIQALKDGPVSIWSGEVWVTESSTSGIQTRVKRTNPSDKIFREAAKMEVSMGIPSTKDVRMYILSELDPAISNYEKLPLMRPLVELGRFDPYIPSWLDLINYYGPANTIQKESFSHILNYSDAQLKEKFGGKVVVVGHASLFEDRAGEQTEMTEDNQLLSIKDKFPITYSSDRMYGAEIHAHIAGNLLQGSWIKRFPRNFEIGVVILFGFISSVISILLRERKFHRLPVLGSVFISLCTFVVTFHLFCNSQIWITGCTVLIVASPLITSVGMYFDYKRLRKKQDEEARMFAETPSS